MKATVHGNRMLVLMDIEWIKRPGKSESLTQLSAVRVRGDWVPQDTYHALVLPEDIDDAEWEHMAFNGHDPIDFRISNQSEADCITAFSQWLREDDIICVWHYTSKKFLKKIWKKALNHAPHNHISIIDEQVYRVLDEDGQNLPGRGLYSIAAAYEIGMPEPKHCAKKDVYLLREILCCIGIDQSVFRPEEPVEVELPRDPEEKEKILSKLASNYVYVSGSLVFHEKRCRHIQRAERVFGCMEFKTVSKSRRPCKVCKPTVAFTKGPDRDVQVTPETWLNGDHSRSDRDLISVRLINGKRINIVAKNVVGHCKNSIHPGKLTKQLLEEHDCIGKKCRHLQRYNSPYWDNYIIQKNAKRQAKEEKKAHKEELRSEVIHLEEVKKELQEYVVSSNSKMEITSVVQQREGIYKVFYVSDNAFADWDGYPEFFSLVELHHPKWRIFLWRVRDTNGRFVTIEQFHAIREIGCISPTAVVCPKTGHWRT